MAKKARFHEVTLKNGHEEWVEIYPAPSKAHLVSALETTDVKVTSVKSLGWLDVAVEANEDVSETKFSVDLENKKHEISRSQLGYRYLASQFHEQVKKMEQDINDYHNP